MVRSFPNIRCCLMVGIGGGAPNLPDHDVRLGDVVVSSTRNGLGGILQYDHGKAIQGQPFRSTQHLNEPPRYLMSAVGELTQRYEMDEMPLQRMVSEALAKKPKLQRKYQRPDAKSDRLYRPDYVHVSGKGGDCSELCGDDASHLVDRPAREKGSDDLIVHRGVIASGSSLMKDATVRDRWAQEKGVLCFEMEAAGLVNTFPCLVIRGICDYSDSHKNDDWHGYAAMMAAAYAKQLLSVLQSWTVEAVDKITGQDLQG
jgi:nucleoside phosphorylase